MTTKHPVNPVNLTRDEWRELYNGVDALSVQFGRSPFADKDGQPIGGRARRMRNGWARILRKIGKYGQAAADNGVVPTT